MGELAVELEYGWQFLKGTSQEFALCAPAEHILYHGTRGPGKTDVQLMRFRRNVGIGYGPFWRGIIFDREYKNLDDLLTKSKRWFTDFGDGARFLESGKDFKWKWPTGEELLFRVAYKPDDYWSYHGHEYAFIGWNELTKYPDGRLYEKMQSINRSSFVPEKDTPVDEAGDYATADKRPLPRIPLETFSTCNPHGAGHSWVKRKFIDVAPDCTIVRRTIEIYNPISKKEEPVTIRQVAIHGHWKENPYLDPKYIMGLHELTDENEKKAWKDGSWDINAGGAIADLWNKHKHVIPRFPIPNNWRLFRTMDWGSSKPFSVGFWAEANGETVEWYDDHQQRQEYTPSRGTLIRFFEWYGHSGELGTNKGILMSSSDVAKGIVLREGLLRQGGWIVGNVSAGPADNSIRSVTDLGTDTTEKLMADHGVIWTSSDKSKGSRKIGLQLFRDRLEATLRGEPGGIQFMDCCRASIALLPELPRDEKEPDDVDTAAEDHIYDEVRYTCLSAGDRTAKVVKILFPH